MYFSAFAIALGDGDAAADAEGFAGDFQSRGGVAALVSGLWTLDLGLWFENKWGNDPTSTQLGLYAYFSHSPMCMRYD